MGWCRCRLDVGAERAGGVGVGVGRCADGTVGVQGGGGDGRLALGTLGHGGGGGFHGSVLFLVGRRREGKAGLGVGGGRCRGGGEAHLLGTAIATVGVGLADHVGETYGSIVNTGVSEGYDLLRRVQRHGTFRLPLLVGELLLEKVGRGGWSIGLIDGTR